MDGYVAMCGGRRDERAHVRHQAEEPGGRQVGGELVHPIDGREVEARHQDAAVVELAALGQQGHHRLGDLLGGIEVAVLRSEEHTSELQSLMRSSYAVVCLKKKKNKKHTR